MKLTVVGAGSAFALKNWQTMYLLEDNGHTMAIDHGSDARHAFNEVGLKAVDIESVYVSHLHGDHLQGLEWLGFSTYFIPGVPRPALYLVDALREPAWRALEPAMGSIQGKIVTLDDYFEVKAVEKNAVIKWNSLKLQPVQTVHVMNGFAIVPSFGLMIEGKQKIFITTDTQFAPHQIMDFYRAADIIIHDCELLYGPDGTPIKSGVHAHFEDLKTLPDHIKKKMWFTHYSDNWEEFVEIAETEGFLGFALQGQVLVDD